MTELVVVIQRTLYAKLPNEPIFKCHCNTKNHVVETGGPENSAL